MSRSLTIALACFALLALPTSAAAAIPPPPGNSAADQYAETYPGAGGNQTTVSPTGSDPAAALGPETAREFQQAGPVGAAAATAAAATAPRRQDAGDPTPAVADKGGSSGPLDVVKHGLGTTGPEGIGLLLPLLLIASLMAAATYVYSRRRRPAAE